MCMQDVHPPGSLVSLRQDLWPDSAFLVTGLVLEDTGDMVLLAPVHPEVERAARDDLILSAEVTGLQTGLVVVGRLAGVFPGSVIGRRSIVLDAAVVEQVKAALTASTCVGPPGRRATRSPMLCFTVVNPWRRGLETSWETYRKQVWSKTAAKRHFPAKNT